MSEVKASANDVRLFFKTADLDLADLVLEIAVETIKGRKALSKKISDNMAKARGARKGPKAKSASTEVAGSSDLQANTQAVAASTQAETPATVASESPIAHARARRAAASAVPSVPAPAHTAEATSVASDTVEL